MLRKIRVAEWMLSLVLTEDRAAAAIGDWMEESDARGSVWFWTCVFRTVGAHVWSEFVESPAEMVWLGLGGFGWNLLVVTGFMASIFLLTIMGHHGDIRYSHDWLWTNTAKNPASPPQMELSWSVQLIWWFLYSARLLQTGRWIARRTPGREIAGCAAVALAGWMTMALWYVVATILSMRGDNIHAVVSVSSVATLVAHDAILFAGALWVRARALRATKRVA